MLNEKFKMRMSALLGEEYEAFSDVLTKEAVRGLRVNTIKTSKDKIESVFGENLIPLSYTDDGYIIRNSSGIGNSPEHHSGMIYIQDPGAMATANALDILPGWKVLDMCSAPGGKSGQAAAKIGDSGFLLSNEYVPKRAKTVVSNFERLGIKNAIVTSLDTEELPKMFSAIFDLVIADVPCSGEGMFRKSDEAVSEWSEENVIACSKRQRDIMKNASPLVKPGGYLLYSTCTYSIEENEMTVDKFLSENEDFDLVPVKKELSDVTRPGITFDGAKCGSLHLTRRFYPHVSEGEGQFIALMKKRENAEALQTILYKDATKPLSKDENAAITRFINACLKHTPEGRIAKVGDNIVILSHGFPVPPKSVFSAGVLAGTVEKGLFFPSHQFFSAYGSLFLKQEDFKAGDVRIAKYLRGEEIEAKQISDGGFCVITYEGAPIGGGKVSLGKIKNHYPKGLRIKN